MLRAGRCSHTLECVIPNLIPEEINDVTAMCRLIHDRHNDPDPSQRYHIPYAFRHGNNDRFNRQTGELMLVDSLGLTCSTFVLTVFESVYLPLIEFNGWEIGTEDKTRHVQLLHDMTTGFPQYGIPPAVPDQVAAVAADLPCIRVRPEETVAAAMFSNRSVGFQEAARGGRWIMEMFTPDWAHASI